MGLMSDAPRKDVKRKIAAAAAAAAIAANFAASIHNEMAAEEAAPLLFLHHHHLILAASTFLSSLPFFHVATLLLLLGAAAALLRHLIRPSSVYVLDFCCYKPDDEQLKCSYEALEFATRINSHRFSLPSMDFMRKIFERSGLGEETYLPPFFRYCPDGIPTSEDARQEAADVMFSAVRLLLHATGVDAADISVLVTNCSLHWPSPSYASMLVNRFKLPEDCKTFNLAGMGCSASVIACKLAADLLKVSAARRAGRRCYALVVSTENITQNYYYGNYKPMLVTNCLFRVGGAAVLLAAGGDEGELRRRSKYRILHVVRTHECADEAYMCAHQDEDGAGKLGISLDKSLMRVAAGALRKNIRTLAPLILPAGEKARYAARYVWAVAEAARRRRRKGAAAAGGEVIIRPPDFRRAVDHFCIHSGGRAVIDEMQKSLGLDDGSVEASRATLHRWGNTSSSSLWYMLAYLEAKSRISAGQKVWMLGLGAGFKCNSAIFLALNSNSNSSAAANPWNDCAHRYPAALRHTIQTLPIAAGRHPPPATLS